MRRRRSLRTRLFAAILFVAIGVLGLSSVATYTLVRRSIEDKALDDLRRRSAALAAEGNRLVAALPPNPENPQSQTERRNELRNQVRRTLDVSDFRLLFLTVGGEIAESDQDPPAGTDVFGLPRELDLADIDPDRLVAGEVVSGTKGDRVYLAQSAGQVRGFTVVVVAIDTIDLAVLTDAQWLLIGVGIGVLVVAAAVAAWLARRLTRPISEIERVARSLASGDLSARAQLGSGTDRELAALADTLNAMGAQLEQARGAERAFLLSVSHDLRTPLTSIRGYAEALADGTIDDADPEARVRAAVVIGAEARRLERLVRDLLELSRVDTPEFSLTPRPCDAGDVMRDAAEAFAPAARDLGLTLVVEPPDPLAADLDPDRLAQIVANLVENALKYATTSVGVAATADAAGNVEIRVTDDGPGLAEPELAKVFDRLYTVRSTPGRSVGTGLGLAIVRELALAMGGAARAETVAGGGSRFVVVLPLGAAAIAR